jgi:hypothetical protein
MTLHEWGFKTAALLCFFVVLLAGILLAVKSVLLGQGSAKRRLVPAALLLFLSCNYWPFFFVEPFSLAAGMVTAGHGAQYCIFMAVYAMNWQPRPERPLERSDAPIAHAALVRGLAGLTMMFGIGVCVWVAITQWVPGRTIFGLDDAQLGGALATLGTSVTMVHYMLDGVLWRLSDGHSRELVVEKYRFLFPTAR